MRRRVIFILALVVIIVVAASGCSLLKKLGLLDETSPAGSIYLSESEAELITEKLPVWLYFTNSDSTELIKLTRYVPKEEAKRSESSFATYIVNELIKGPGKNTGLAGTIPEGTALCGPVTISNGLAVVDLNSKFVQNHPGGKEAEMMTVYSIVNTLTELKEIQKVSFRIDGNAVADFKGSLRFDAEFPRTESLISDDPPVHETLLNLGGEEAEFEDTEGASGEYLELLEDEEDGGVDVLEELDTEDSDVFEQDSGDDYIEILE